MKASLLPPTKYLHDPCYVRLFLGFLQESGASIASFLQESPPHSSWYLFHQSAIEIAFHPHMEIQGKQRFIRLICQYIREWPQTIKQQLKPEITTLRQRLLVFSNAILRENAGAKPTASRLVVLFHDELISSLLCTAAAPRAKNLSLLS
ncbi:MAG: hypothetical protein ACOH5I_09875 [Oligoflexus sp.]